MRDYHVIVQFADGASREYKVATTTIKRAKAIALKLAHADRPFAGSPWIQIVEAI